MTESADKTEGLQAALHNSAAAQQREQLSRLSFPSFLAVQHCRHEPADVSESQSSHFPFFFFPYIMEALQFPTLTLLKIFSSILHLPSYVIFENCSSSHVHY